MADLDRKSLLAATFGLSAGGAAIGAIAGALLGLLGALLVALPPILDWYRSQPPDWSIFTGAIAAVSFLFLAAIVMAIGAVLCALAGAAASVVISAIFLTKKPPQPPPA